MFWNSTQLKLVVLTCACVGACTKKADHDTRRPVDSFVQAVSRAQNALDVSERIRTATFENCDAVGRGVDALEAAIEDDAVLRGLIEELIPRAHGVCSEAQLSKWPAGRASQLYRSLLESDPEAALEVLAGAPNSAVILRRRSELLFAVGNTLEGRKVLIDSLSLDEDASVRAHATRLLRIGGELDAALALVNAGKNASDPMLERERVATLAALTRYADVVRALAVADAHVRVELAEAAVGAAPDPIALGLAPGAVSELPMAAARVPGLSGQQSVKLLRGAAEVDPKNADVWSTLAEAEEGIGQRAAAIVAWDRAAAIALGAERPVLAPIRLLRELGETREALVRAERIAESGRIERNSDRLHLASQAFRYAGDTERAVLLAREALALRAGEGRLRSELAHRLREAGRESEAAEELATLLVCGSRGRPWHRHEVIARLAALVGQSGVSAAVAAVPCEVVEAEELASMLEHPPEPTEH